MAVTVLQEDFDSFTDWTVTGSPAVRTGRTGKGVSTTSTQKLVYTIPGASESDTIIVGFAWKMDGVQARAILNLQSDSGATAHIQLAAAASGVFNVLRGGTTIASTATGMYVANTWVYLELQVKLADSPNGTVKLRVNGVERINTTGLDTKNAGTKTTFDRVELAAAAANMETFDDLYIITGADGVFADQPRFGTGPFDVIHEPFDDLTAWTPTGTPAVVAGRTGTAVELVSTDKVALPIPVGQQSYFVIVGFAFHATQLAASSDFVRFMQGGVQQTALRVTSTGVLSCLGSAPTAAGTVVVNTWCYIEAKVLISATAGAAITTRVNDVVKSTLENTAMTATTGITSIELLSASVAGITRFDDLYVQTGTLADFEGDQEIAEPGATVRVWSGSAFADAPVKVWSGSAFTDAAAVKTWNGSAYV